MSNQKKDLGATPALAIDAGADATTTVEKKGIALVKTSNNKNTLDSMPVSQQSTILARRIQKTCTSADKALELMEPYKDPSISGDWEEAWFATLQLCGKQRDYQQAIRLVQAYTPESDRCRSLAISICGRCHQIDKALALVLEDEDKISTPAPYNAAIAACGPNRAWKDALRLVQEVMPQRFATSLSCNAVLTALAKSQRGTEALEFLKNGFDRLGVTRDRLSYHHTLATLLSQGNRIEEAVRLVLKDMREEAQTNPDVTPNSETFDRLIATVVAKRNSVAEEEQAHYNALLQQLQDASQGAPTQAETKKEFKKKTKRKRGEWADIGNIKAHKRAKLDPHLAPSVLPWDFAKWDLPKRGKGKTAHWELGVVHDKNSDNIRVGLHPNRNPSKNGIQLWFFRDGEDGKLQKLGYLLMINTPNYDNDNSKSQGTSKQTNAEGQASSKSTSSAGVSQFLGLRVTDDERRGGLAKIFVAIWLQCCLDANIQPTTGKMNKPLLCLVLQHAYNFTPIIGSGAVKAKLLPSKGDNSRVVRLTTESSGVKNLAGALSPRDIQEQKVEFVAPTEATEEGGRPIDVGGLLKAPAKEELGQSIQRVVQDRWKPSPKILRGKDAVESTVQHVEKEDAMTMSKLFLGM